MIITRTPFRISFFGGGTDIPEFYLKNGGEVLSTTIDKYLYITCRRMPPFFSEKHRFVYGSKTELVSDIERIEHPSIRETMRYLKINYVIDMHYNTDIPARSGIGSSSSFTVGLLNALNGLEGRIISKSQLMHDAIYVEQNMIKEPVGSQDQTAAAYGGFNHIVFRQDGEIEVHPITISQDRVKELNRHLLLVNHKIKELQEMKSYVSQALEILNSNSNLYEFGKLLNETWMRKKELSYNVSDERIDELYNRGIKNGAIGGKLLGAGGGGFMLFFVKPEDRKRLKEALYDFLCVPFSFENTGSQVIYYRPEDEIIREPYKLPKKGHIE